VLRHHQVVQTDKVRPVQLHPRHSVVARLWAWAEEHYRGGWILLVTITLLFWAWAIALSSGLTQQVP